MTNLLQRAIAELKISPSNEQVEIGKIILKEIEDEQRGDKTFSASADILAKLANIAMIEYEEGKTEELDISEVEIR